ncbi:hybrid sensor histidine kinase/response regulator [Caballeronia sordidicola]|uniref:hybrid sensor histidine kinase/response regulator n=1 Tax=Caballeronia sordidicola TaxID=196367 RepID=UPI00117E28F9|nr:ATP-binding protein [Caballeronia sordidicola]
MNTLETEYNSIQNALAGRYITSTFTASAEYVHPLLSISLEHQLRLTCSVLALSALGSPSLLSTHTNSVAVAFFATCIFVCFIELRVDETCAAIYYGIRMNIDRQPPVAYDFGRRGDSDLIPFDSVITVDVTGRVLWMNSQAERLTEWSIADARGKTLQHVFSTENDYVGLFEISRKISPECNSRSIDGAVSTKNGLSKYVIGSAIDLNPPQGVATGLLVFAEEIRSRDHNSMFAEKHSAAQSVIDSLPFPLLVLNTDLSINAANPDFYHTFGVTPAETLGVKLDALGSGQWAKIDVDGVLDGLIQGQPGSRRCLVEDFFPSLGKRTMQVSATVLSLFGQTEDLILVTIEDVSERQTAERALRDSELRYRRLFETAKDGILILDAQTLVIVDANRYIADLLGYSHGALVGKELWEIGFFADKEASQATYTHLQQYGYVRYDSLPLKTMAGKPAEVEFISNVYSVAGQPIAQCNIRDISDRVRMQDVLKQQAAALTELHHKKDEFLAMLSHELRNPLAPITNAVRLLRHHEIKDATMDRACVIIERQLVQLTRLVDDLVEVSRITTGRVRLRLERVTIQEILSRALETTQPLIEQRHHRVSVSLGENLIWINGDASRLEQAMVNLLANAAKYTDEGGTIALSVELEETNCVVRVRDSGVGIAPELLPHIYELFTQAERSLARSRGGLGIGLALVKRIVEMHDGIIDVHSVLNEGTEFVIRLPIAASSATQTLPVTESSIESTTALRILVVDDNVDTAESMAMLVGMLGHVVRMEHDGNSALRAASEFRPDVVLLDIGLPGLNGYEVASRIREQPSLDHTVLVAITGYGHETDRQLGLKAGIDHYLVKPVDFDRVRRILGTVADRAVTPTHLEP